MTIWLGLSAWLFIGLGLHALVESEIKLRGKDLGSPKLQAWTIFWCLTVWPWFVVMYFRLLIKNKSKR